MSDLDLTEAVEAAALAWLKSENQEESGPRGAADAEWAWTLPGFAESRAEYKRHTAAALAAATPLIEAQVREQVAREIRADGERVRKLSWGDAANTCASWQMDGYMRSESVARGQK